MKIKVNKHKLNIPLSRFSVRKSNSATHVLLTLRTFPPHWVSPRQETIASKNCNSVSLRSTSFNNVNSHALFYRGHLVMRSKRCAVQNQGITLIENHPLPITIYREPPLISHRRGKSLKDILVRAKLWRSKYCYITKHRESCLACQPLLAAVCNSSDVCPSVFHKIKKVNELSFKT